MSSSKQNLVFYYDISCPFAYIASTRVEALAERTNANLIWTPVLLGAIYRLTAAPQGAAGSASDVFNPTKKAITAASFARTLKRYQIPYNLESTHLRKTVKALRILRQFQGEDRVKLTKALYRAYWVESADITRNDVLLEIVKKAGLSSASGIDESVFENQQDRNNLEDATNQVIAQGSPGVPAFWIENEKWIDHKGVSKKGRLYWGQDRMLFVEAVLKALNAGVPFDQVPRISELHPRCIRNPSQELLKNGVKLEFWYDFSSPWAFLGWNLLDLLRDRFGASLEIELKPFLLGALFREIGAPMLPGAALSEQKRYYSNQDLFDWVRYWNALHAQEKVLKKRIEFKYTDFFPIRTPTLLRCALVEPKCQDALYRACWEQNLDIANERVLLETLTKAGFNGPELIKRASQQSVKDQLRANTQEAKDAGICGVPSYRVSHRTAEGWKTNPAIVWGQDEINVVMDMIAGWTEESNETAKVGGDGDVSGRTKL